MTDKPMSFDVLDAVMALPAARLGDMSGLAERVRDGAELSTEEREFIADFLIGVAKIDDKGSGKAETVEGLVSLGWWVLRIQAKRGGKLEAAYADVMDMTGLGLRTLKSAVKACREGPGAAGRIAYFKHLKDLKNEKCKSA